MINSDSNCKIRNSQDNNNQKCREAVETVKLRKIKNKVNYCHFSNAKFNLQKKCIIGVSEIQSNANFDENSNENNLKEKVESGNAKKCSSTPIVITVSAPKPANPTVKDNQKLKQSSRSSSRNIDQKNKISNAEVTRKAPKNNRKTKKSSKFQNIVSKTTTSKTEVMKPAIEEGHFGNAIEKVDVQSSANEKPAALYQALQKCHEKINGRNKVLEKGASRLVFLPTAFVEGMMSEQLIKHLYAPFDTRDICEFYSESGKRIGNGTLLVPAFQEERFINWAKDMPWCALKTYQNKIHTSAEKNEFISLLISGIPKNESKDNVVKFFKSALQTSYVEMLFDKNSAFLGKILTKSTKENASEFMKTSVYGPKSTTANLETWSIE